jgi:adenylate cyclase
VRTANLAIVFTDIKGFTERTSQQTLEQNQQLLAQHEKLLAPLFHGFGGRIIKTIGDAFLVTFESPTQAVLCGAAIQDRLWIHNREVPAAERIEVRVAINVGEVRIESRDVFGEPVNIAARVEALAEAGQVYFTEAVYLAMNKAEVPSEEVGSFDLKGIPGKVKVYRIPLAPYRVESASAEPPEALPPYGNLGLSRFREDSPLRRLTDPGELRAAGVQLKDVVSTLGKDAAELGQRAVSYGGGLMKAHRGRVDPRWVKAALAAVALVALVGAGSWVFGSEVSRAVSAVGRADPGEREARAQRARAVIAKIDAPADRAFWSGRLAEASGDPAGATSHYRSAVRAGSGAASSRLVDLLDHEQCPVRVAAARALGELKVTSARRALKALAEDGGSDDQGSGGVIGKVFGGCSSKDAARAALRQLEGR